MPPSVHKHIPEPAELNFILLIIKMLFFFLITENTTNEKLQLRYKCIKNVSKSNGEVVTEWYVFTLIIHRGPQCE